jgi:hypothetical protein
LLRDGLHALAERFDELAIPQQGRYVGRPARADATGVVAVPPDTSSPWTRLAVGLGIGIAAGLAVAAILPHGRRG